MNTHPSSNGDHTLQLSYHEFQLANGLRVVVHEDSTAPVAAVHLWYHVGSKNERSDRRGFAHMFEHMMFRGSDRLGPEGHFDAIRRTGGDANAYTTFDQTVYVQEIPSDQLELVFWLESERMAFLRIDDQGYATERNVVAEELRMIADAPYGTLADKVLSRVFPGHPYGSTPGGQIEHLRRAQSVELQEFWESYYVPSNATLLVVGDVTQQQVEQLAEKYFGWMPLFPVPPDPKLPALPQRHDPILIDERNGPAPIVALGWRGIAAGHPDELALEVAADILGQGESSRLFSELVVRQSRAVMAGAQFQALQVDGLFGAFAILKPMSRQSRRVLEILRQSVADLRDHGPTLEELEKARNWALRNTITSLANVSSKAQVLGQAAVVERDLPSVNLYLQRIRALTPEIIRDVARRHLSDDHAIELRVKPSLLRFLWNRLLGGDKAAAHEFDSDNTEIKPSHSGSGKPGLTRPPSLPPSPPLQPLRAQLPAHPLQSFTLDNGLRCVVLEDRRLPFVSFSLGCRHGAAAEPRGGASSYALELAIRATEKRDYATLTRELDHHALSIQSDCGMDGVSLSASCVNSEADRALALLAEIVCSPAFPEQQLRTLKRQGKTAAAIQERDPGTLADRALRQALFGEHPYSRDPQGTTLEIGALEVEHLRSWWQRLLNPSHCVLYLAGDIDRSGAEKLCRYFAPWTTTQVPLPALSLPFPGPGSTQISLLRKRGRQAQVRIGQRSITRHDPRYFEARVLSQIFGGGFNSRLNHALRVERGLTYGASGGLRSLRSMGQFVAQTSTRVETAAQAIEVMLAELQRLRETPPTAEELDMAIGYMVGNHLLARQTPDAIISDHWLLEQDGLPDDFFERYLEGVRTTTPQRLMSVAQDLIDPDQLSVVVVGPKSLTSELESIAPVKIL